ncbi:Cytochrome c oxidase subunit 5B, mitochondrial [Malassezia sp. CBS 17886]|nr:Cytochrome c oxidase subunit 5B, mitochondrial [Malassezia sp. CBS 17886]
MSMIRSVRTSLPRALPRLVPVSARTIITKSERWTPDTVSEGDQLLIDNNALKLGEVLPNLEAKWPKLNRVEQYTVYKMLEEVQRRDWHELSIDEKKGGQLGRVVLGTALAVASGMAAFALIRSKAEEPPKTLTTEYEKQENKRAIDTKQNPITGIASDDYKGKGYIT